MAVIVVGLNNKSAPLEILERTTIAPGDLAKALTSLKSRDNISEVVVVSTCMRTEIYALAERFHGAVADAMEFLGDLCGVDISEVAYNYFDQACVSHLFRVAAGLDSAVVGEGEVLGQLKDAWISAMDERASGPTLNALFRHAVEVGKKTRTQVKMPGDIGSLSDAAVAIVEGHYGVVPAGRRVLVVGKGAMSGSIASRVTKTWPMVHVEVADRTTDLDLELTRADVVFCATSTPEIIISPSQVTNRQMVLVDLAVPRNISPDVDAVHFDIEDLSAFVAPKSSPGQVSKIAEIARIVEDEVARLQELTSARLVSPVVAQIREHFDEIRAKELTKRAHKLEPSQLDEVDQVTKAIVAKLLHGPTVKLKGAAGTPKGERLVESLRDLFDLGDR